MSTEMMSGVSNEPSMASGPRAVGSQVVSKGRAARAFAIVAICGAVVALGFGVRMLVQGAASATQPLIYYTVSRTVLPITVSERGNLESQLKTEIRCKVDSFSFEGSGTSGTQILKIVSNGSAVKEGDLLVELDSAPLKERLDTQILATDKGEAEMIQAQVKFENQKTQNETAEEEALLQVELADDALKMYTDPDDGTLRISLQELKLNIEEAQNSILEAQANMEMQEIEHSGIKQLRNLGYRGQGSLRQAFLSYLKSQNTLVDAHNRLANLRSAFNKLEKYEGPMQIKTLGGDLNTTQRALIQVRRDNTALLEQARAAKDGAERRYAKESERLKNYESQLENCKIYAPHAGMVVYATQRRGGSEIQEGAFVRQRQHILSLPNLAKMQVETAVHESVLDQVKVGLKATIRIDPFPDKTYEGEVASVGVLPDRGGWSGSDIKVYKTIVTLSKDVDLLKPGMTAEVQIHVDEIADVTSIPVQAIVQVRDETWCYVDNGAVEKRPIELGRSNEKFVEIRSGITAGDRVVLNPMALLDESELEVEDELDPSAGMQPSETETRSDPGSANQPKSKGRRADGASKPKAKA